MSLKYGILGLISKEPLHGYEVKTRFEAMLGGTWEVNIGQVYSTLQRLERDELVEAGGRRGDRGRPAYHVTDAGRAEPQRRLIDPDAAPQQIHDHRFLQLMAIRRLSDAK